MFLKYVLLFIFVPLSLFATEDDLYDFLWLDPDKKVYVLQNKTYKKEKSFYSSLGLINGLTNEYQKTFGAHLKQGYFFTEEWAIEAVYSRYSNSNNSTYDNLGYINGVVPFTRTIESSYGLLGVWSPFYGKINTFNKIFYFDWFIGLGLGRVHARSNVDSAADENDNTFTNESYLSGMGKTGLRFHASKKVHVDVEYYNTFYRAGGPDKTKGSSWRSNGDIIISIGINY